MKFTLAPLALAMVLATVAFAQDTTTASEPEPEASTSSEPAAPESTSAPAPEPTTAASEGGSSVCPLLPGYEEGDPLIPFYGCTYSSTSTPPYESESLASYLIGQYRPGKEGYFPEDVASELAESAVRFYPTLTQDFDAIRDQYAEAITASIESLMAEGASAPDSAQGVVSNKLLQVAGLAAAVVAGGAFLL